MVALCFCKPLILFQDLLLPVDSEVCMVVFDFAFGLVSKVGLILLAVLCYCSYSVSTYLGGEALPGDSFI